MVSTTLNRALGQLKNLPDLIDAEKVFVSYDRESDSVTVHLFGTGIPGVSLNVTDEMMLRWDRDGERLVGFQIEHFLSRVAPEHPHLLDILDIAELRGITAGEVGEIRREIVQKQRGTAVGRVVKDLDAAANAAD